MAKQASRPGRTLIAFVLVVLAMYGGLALNGEWTPKLGLDLQGGTRITLEASTDTGEDITPEKLEEAAAIIDSRVNAYGVAESEVSTQGERPDRHCDAGSHAVGEPRGPRGLRRVGPRRPDPLAGRRWP
jgi:preprotein translocase subunit SecD